MKWPRLWLRALMQMIFKNVCYWFSVVVQCRWLWAPQLRRIFRRPHSRPWVAWFLSFGGRRQGPLGDPRRSNLFLDVAESFALVGVPPCRSCSPASPTKLLRSSKWWGCKRRCSRSRKWPPKSLLPPPLASKNHDAIITKINESIMTTSLPLAVLGARLRSGCHYKTTTFFQGLCVALPSTPTLLLLLLLHQGSSSSTMWRVN